MIQKIALTIFLGQPILILMGILTLLLLLTTATVGFLNFKGNTIIPFKWHPRLAATTIAVALIHALFALSLQFNF